MSPEAREVLAAFRYFFTVIAVFGVISLGALMLIFAPTWLLVGGVVVLLAVLVAVIGVLYRRERLDQEGPGESE